MSAATSLTVSDLFTPAPSGVGANGSTTAPAPGSWLSIELQIATTVQLPTTSWQSGAPERTILAINAVCLSQDDAIISTMAQGGFLDSAATGTTTYQALNGVMVTVPVTPDPSIPSQNPTGAPGWLDLLVESIYEEERLAATPASGPLALVNTGASTQGPFSAGQYHCANTLTGATYSNPAAFSVPSSQIHGMGGVITGVTPGLTTTVIVTQSAHGLAAGNVVYVNVPVSAGISGLAGVFAIVASVTINTLAISVGSSGAYTGSAGTVYLCTVATMSADITGLSGNAAPGSVTSPITQATGVSISNVVAWSGANWESNQALVARTRLGLAAASPNGPAQAYVYFALTAQQILAAATPSYTFTNGPIIAANAFSNPQTGLVQTVVASATPASTTLGANVTPGCAQNAVTAATNANPIQITTSAAHGLTSGMVATISGILGNASANGTNVVTVVDEFNFTIPVAGSGAYTGGGSVEGGDLGAVDNLLLQNVTDDSTTSIASSALAFPITVIATVVVPQAFVATYQLAVKASLQAYLASLPIGGVFSPSETVPVAIDGVIGALEDAGVLTLGAASYVRAIQGLTVNGVTTDVPFPVDLYQALLAAGTAISVVGV